MITDEDVVKRWAKTGLLDTTPPSKAVKAARRLDAAASRALAGEADAIEKEIVKLRGEGLFGT